MRKNLLLALTCVLLFTAGLAAQTEKKEKKVLKNADIVLMTQNHFDDETLTKIIEVSDTDFDISGDALIDLNNKGVSPAVLRAMLQATQNKKQAAQPVTPTAAPAPSAASSTSSATPQATSQPASEPALATREAESATPPVTAATPAAPAGFGAMRGTGGMMGMNPQQLAAMQSQLASMGMGGMMGGMFSTTSYSPEQMPHVFLMNGPNQGKQEISPSTAQIGQTKYKGGVSSGGMMLRSLATEGLSFAAMGAGPGGMMAMSAFSMASGFMPGMRPGAPSMTYVWGLPGRKSSREFPDPNPVFELSYGDIPGVDPDGYEPAVLQLVQTKDNYRLVGATQTKMDSKHMMSGGGGPEGGKWLSEERWPCRVDKEERGFYIVHVEKPLDPGEYAVVLRPVKHYKAASSGFGGGAQVFYSVWDFSVPGTPVDTGKKKK
ncbi:MAG: hypothetical protein LAO03_00890 [Acidobacteriia bacterium]|nr:hypothetical protein [Terriglobia bacterium]